MTIAYRGISNAAGEGSTGATSITLTKPGSTAENDLMVAFFCIENNSDLVNSIPSGWALVSAASGALAARAHRLYVYWKRAGASEGSNYQWGFSSSVECWGGIVSLYYDSAGSLCSIGNAGLTATDSNADGNAPAPSITIQLANNWALHIASTMRGTTTTPPNGSPTYTERLDGQSGTGTTNLTIGMSSAAYTSTGGTGIKTAVFAAADYKIAAHVEITVAAAPQVYNEEFSLGASATADLLASLTLNPLFALGASALLTASTPAFFYVDPDWTGTHSGTEAEPWSEINWPAVNAALANSPVTVYFSAREASSDVDQDGNKGNLAEGYLHLQRTDTSTNLLTLDGHSKYNTSDSSPSWANYTGTSHYHTHGQDYGIAGFNTDGLQNYVTIRGFKATYHGTSGTIFGILLHGGNHLTVEECVTDPGDIYFDYAYKQAGGGNGGCSYVTIQNNVVHYPRGEGIYIGGSEGTGNPAHDYVTIKGNTVYDCGHDTGEGDGIDVKDKITHLVIEENVVYSNHWHGIVVNGSGGTIRKNTVYGNTYKGIYIQSSYAAVPAVQIDNNVVRDNGDRGVFLQESTYAVDNIVIVHNACRNNGTIGDYYANIETEVDSSRSVTLKNNATTAVANNYGYEAHLTGTITEDYNDFHGQIAGFTRGAHDLNTDPLFTSTTNLKIQSTSPCRDAGLLYTGIDYDIEGTLRPQGDDVDMGAYELLASQTYNETFGLGAAAVHTPGGNLVLNPFFTLSGEAVKTSAGSLAMGVSCTLDAGALATLMGGLVLDSLFTLAAEASKTPAASLTVNQAFSLGASAVKTVAGNLILGANITLPAEGAITPLGNLIMDAGVSLANTATDGMSGGMNFAEAITIVANAVEAVAPYLTVATSTQLQANAALAAAAQQDLLGQLGLTAGASEAVAGTGIWDRTASLAAQATMSEEAGFIFQGQLILNATSLLTFDRFLAVFKDVILGASAAEQAQATLISDALISLGVTAEQLQAAFRAIELGISLAAETLLAASGTVLGAPPLPDIIVAALRAMTDPQRIRPEIDEWRVTALEDPRRIKH